MILISLFCWVLAIAIGFVTHTYTDNVIISILAGFITLAVLMLMHQSAKLYRVFSILFGILFGGFASAFILMIIQATKYKYCDIKVEELDKTLIIGTILVCVTYSYAWAKSILFIEYNHIADIGFFESVKMDKKFSDIKRDRKKQQKEIKKQESPLNEKQIKEEPKMETTPPPSDKTKGYFNI